MRKCIFSQSKEFNFQNFSVTSASTTWPPWRTLSLAPPPPPPSLFQNFWILHWKVIYIFIFPGICLRQYTKEDRAVVCTKVWLIARCQRRTLAVDQPMRIHIISIHVLTWGLSKPSSLRKKTLFSGPMQWIKSKLGYYASLPIARFGVHTYQMMHQSIMIMISLWATNHPLRQDVFIEAGYWSPGRIWGC